MVIDYYFESTHSKMQLGKK